MKKEYRRADKPRYILRAVWYCATDYYWRPYRVIDGYRLPIDTRIPRVY